MNWYDGRYISILEHGSPAEILASTTKIENGWSASIAGDSPLQLGTFSDRYSAKHAVELYIGSQEVTPILERMSA